MEGQFVFYFKAEDEERLIQFPIPPSEMKTVVVSRNTTIETVALGEVNILKDIGLRCLSFEMLLPDDLDLPFVQGSIDGGVVGKPVFYLAWLREVMARKVPLRLIISRNLPDGTSSFPGNMLVSLEEYSVIEHGGGVGDYNITIKLKEYRKRDILKSDELFKKSAANSATTAPNINTYTIRSGDTLWLIAKKYLGDGSRYKEIAVLNGITNYNNLIVGTVIKLS